MFTIMFWNFFIWHKSNNRQKQVEHVFKLLMDSEKFKDTPSVYEHLCDQLRNLVEYQFILIIQLEMICL